MPRFPIPEILRTPLEALFLQVKAMNEETDVQAFLRSADVSPLTASISSSFVFDLGSS